MTRARLTKANQPYWKTSGRELSAFSNAADRILISPLTARNLIGGPRIPACNLFGTGLQLEAFQVLAKGAAQIVAAQRKLHGGFEEAEFVAGIVAGAFEAVGIDGTAAEQVL